MSNHLIDCAAAVQGITPSQKLLLICLADSSRDGSGRVAAPGHEKVKEWTGLGRTAVVDATNALIDAGHIRRLARGQKRVKAEFLVFPNGCCDLHGRRFDRQDLPFSGTGGPVAEHVSSRSQGPVYRLLSTSQQPVKDLSATGLAVSATGLDRSPSQRTSLKPPPPPSSVAPRTASPSREEAAQPWTLLFANSQDLAEFVAELSTIRREIGQPTSRWTLYAVRSAIAKAHEAGYDPAAMTAALRAVARDPRTDLPGRLAAPGPWWDATELVDLQHARLAREQAAQARQQRTCDCDHGWVTGADSKPKHCPTCHPSAASGSHA